MAVFTQVDPESFIDKKSLPATGRGAWVKRGIEFDYRYALSPDPRLRIGSRCGESLDHWSVGAGSWAIQARLVSLQLMTPVSSTEKGIYGPRTKAAVMAFQSQNKDPAGGRPLAVDGIVGRTDARALFTPLIAMAEARYSIPNRLLLGETNHESLLDPGAVGYFIYYPDYRGVDRGQSQINSKANPQVSWEQAFSPVYALDWSAKRLRTYYDRYAAQYPGTSQDQLWCASVCAHNNPSAAELWARSGAPSTTAAANYVNAVLNARY